MIRAKIAQKIFKANLGLLPTPKDKKDFQTGLFGWFDYKPKHKRHIIKTLSIKNQERTNCCQWFSTAVQKEIDEKIRLSARSIVIKGKAMGLVKSNGFSNLRSGQKVLQKWGILPEGVIDERITSWRDYSDIKALENTDSIASRHKISSYWTVSNRNDALKLLDKGKTISTGISWYSGYNQKGGFKMPWIIWKAIGWLVGGHAYCCHPDTSIQTDIGNKKICDIKVGENILTRDGYKAVLKTSKRKVDEILYCFKSSLSLDKLKVTGEHPVLVRKSAPQTKLKQFFRTKTFFSGLEFIKAQDIKAGYFVITKVDNTIKNNNIDKNFARLLGYYIGDGNIAIRYSINGNIKSAKFRLTYHRDNKKEMVDDLINIVKKYNPNINYNIYETKNSLTNTITFYSTVLAKEILYYCGGANDKYISEELLYMELDKQTEFLKGWFSADGCGEFLVKGLISTTPVNLAENLLFILQRNKLSYSTVITSAKENIVFPNGTYNTKKCHHISFHTPRKNDRIKYKDDYIITRIMGVEIEDYKGYVHNLEVKDKNEYIADNVLVHNCIIGYDLNYRTKKVYVCQNSYGRGWGDDGKFYVDMDWLDKKNYGYFTNLDEVDKGLGEFLRDYDGQNVKGKGSSSIYHIQRGKKKPYLDWESYLAWNGKVRGFKEIDKNILDKVETGEIMDIKKTDYWNFLKDVKESNRLDALLLLLNKE
jgi:hypothetical protein